MAATVHRTANDAVNRMPAPKAEPEEPEEPEAPEAGEPDPVQTDAPEAPQAPPAPDPIEAGMEYLRTRCYRTEVSMVSV